jgi:HSP20 family protein
MLAPECQLRRSGCVSWRSRTGLIVCKPEAAKPPKDLLFVLTQHLHFSCILPTRGSYHYTIVIKQTLQLSKGETDMTYYFTTRPIHNHSNHTETEYHLPMDVSEIENGYALRAIVPGLTAEDLNIQVIENVVTIEGEYKAEESEYLLRELPAGKFHRSLRMPADLDATKAAAEIKDGILTVRLPKAEHALPKQIKVSVN